MSARPRPPLQLLLSNSIPEPNSGCWLWTGAIMHKGYGLCRSVAFPGEQRAHRVSYLIFKGPIPEGLFVCHSCDVRSCVNPDHLWLGTAYDNLIDMVRKGRHPHIARIPNARTSYAMPSPLPTPPPRGRGRFPRSKLSDEAVRYVRTNAERSGVRALGAAVGVSPATISKLLTGQTYKHVAVLPDGV